jgi:hypothetical protein
MPLGRHLGGRYADLLAELPEAHMVPVFFHGDAAAEPLGIGRRRQCDGWLVEHARAVELVDGVAAHDLAHRLLVFGRRSGEFGDGFHLRVGFFHGRIKPDPLTRGNAIGDALASRVPA